MIPPFCPFCVSIMCERNEWVQNDSGDGEYLMRSYHCENMRCTGKERR